MDLAVLVFQNEVQANIFAKIIENNSLSSAAELQNHIAGILVEPEDPLCYLKTRLNFNFAPFTTSVYQSAALDEMVNLKYAKNMLKKASIKTWADIKKTKLKRIPCYVLGGKYVVFVSSRSVKMRGFSFFSLYKSLFIFQILNVKMYNYGKQNIIVNFIIKKLNKTQFHQKV